MLQTNTGKVLIKGEGKSLWVLGDHMVEATSGVFVHIPRRAVHTFKNVGAAPGRFLVLTTPAGIEDFFEEIGEPVTDSSAPPTGPPDVEKLAATARKYGIEILAPPAS